MQAAKYLGVAPWDLLERGSHWTEWALIAAEAEAEARAELERKAQR